MSNSEIKNLEAYLFSENKQDFLKTQISGTDSYYFYAVLNALNKYGYNLPEDAQVLIQKYKQFSTQRSKGIFLKHWLLKLENPESSTEEKQQAIKEINDLIFRLQFNHVQPGNVSTSNLTQVQSEYSSNLDVSLIQFERLVDESIMRKDLNQVNTLIMIDPEKVFATENLELIRTYLTQVELAVLVNGPQLVKRYYQLYQKKNVNKKNYETSIFRTMTLEQLIELGKLEADLNKEKDYLGELMRKKFRLGNDTSIRGYNNKEQRRQKLLEMWEWSKNIHSEFYSLARQILYEILILDTELNTYDQGLFIEYLQYPIRGYSNAQQSVNVTNKNLTYDSFWHQVHNFVVGRWVDVDQLIEKYLRRFFQDKETVQPFDDYLDSKYLKRLFYEVKLQQGRELENITDLLSGNQIEQLKNKKEITILPDNKEHFGQGEEVFLKVEVKNINVLVVKVFEINTEQYYKKNYAAVDSNINLDGLRASEEKIIQYDQAPIVKVAQDIKFESITKKENGIFVVELIGNGISSRAIIKKGRLTVIDKVTPAGIQFQIINEQLQVCKGQNTGIYIEGKFHRVNDEGKVLIPFTQSDRNVNGIVQHEDFAELVNIQLYQEQIEFKCAFLYSSEQFLAGSKAKVLLQPRLYICRYQAPLELIKDVQVRVTAIAETGVPVSHIFDQLKLDVQRDIEVEFPVPAKLQRIDIEISGNVTTMLQKKKQHIQQQQSINFNLHQGVNENACQLLKYTIENGYEIHVLGKNGEPKRKVLVEVSLKHKQYKQQINTNLLTNDNGAVILGQLPQIISVQAATIPSLDHPKIRNTWNIQYKQSQYNYPNDVIICENDQIVLPYTNTSNNNSNKQVELFEVLKSPQSFIQNLTEKSLKVQEGDKAVTISNLVPGYYVLVFYGIQQTVNIQVVQGQYWNNSSLIATQSKLIEVSNQMSNLQIDNVNVDRETNKLTFQVYSDKAPQYTRAHVFAYQWLPQNVQQLQNVLQDVSLRPPERQFKLNETANLYLSNKKLGDEYVYVLDRKNQTRYIGNTLEKPQLLLKRTFIRDTNEKKEELSGGNSYKDAKLDYDRNDESSRKSRTTASSYMSLGQQAYGGSGSSGSQQNEESFVNFMQYPATLIGNLKPNEEGIITVENLNLEIYQSIQIVVSNLDSAVNQVIPLNRRELLTKDLRYKQNRKENSFYSITRNTDMIQQGETIVLQNFTSAEFQVVDSLSKVFELQREIRNSRGNDRENEIGYNFWGFLKTWNTLTYEEKNQKYDQYSSHELNLFLYYHDTEYFQSFVKPFITNKIEKTFIDYYLLNHSEKLNEYSKVENLENLNVLETVLLISYLVNNQQQDIAKAIVESLEYKNKLIYYDLNTFKKYFDTVIHAKKSDELQKEISSSRSGPEPPGAGGPPVMYAQAPMMQNFQAPMTQNFAMHANLEMAQPRSLKKAYAMAGVPAPPPGGVLRKQQMEMMPMSETFSIEEKSMQQLVQQRESYTPGFENLEKTKEYAERNYMNNTSQQNVGLVNVNPFWVDYARYILERGNNDNNNNNNKDQVFLSQNFIYATNNHTEMVAALSVLQLPFSSGSHTYTTIEDRNLQIQADSNMMLYQKVIKETQPDLRVDILIAQRFFDVYDRYEYTEDNEKVEKDVEEYIVDRIYGCQTIVTNCTVARQIFQVLVEVPEGAVPVNTLDISKSHTITLESFNTKIIDYYFYFPSQGAYKLLPANVSKDGKVLAVSKEKLFEVKEIRTSVQLDNIVSILSSGSKEDILQYIATKNLYQAQTFRFSDLYWLLKDYDFYKKFTDILRNRRIYDHGTWSYAFYHKDQQTVGEYMNYTSSKDILCIYVKYLKSSLVSIQQYRFYEYFPLVNPRVHQLNKNSSNILNNEFRQQYQTFLEYLIEVPTPSNSELLALAYYLLLQDRVDEAIKIFNGVDKSQIINENHQGKLQYDYFAAYIDFYTGYPNFDIARNIAEDYLDYPVLSWRKLFIEISNQLAEYYGEDDVSIELQGLALADDEDDERQKKNTGAATEEILNLELQDHKLILIYQNIEKISIKYYEIDLEILFSRNPFFLQSEGDFGYVKPNYEETVNVEKSHVLEKQTVKIAEQFAKKNVFIQVTTQNRTVSTTYFSTNVKVQIIENFGQIKVTDSENKPLSKVYVKTFAKLKSGGNRFYKDGYTDLRGRFDYASLNSDELKLIEKFAIFVMSDEYGSIIKEANTPSTLGRIDNSLVLISKKAQVLQSQNRQKWNK